MSEFLSSNLLFNIIWALTLFSILFLVAEWQVKRHKEKQLRGLIDSKTLKQRVSRVKLLQQYRLVIRQTLRDKNHEAQEDLVYYSTLGLVAFIFVYFVFLGNYFLAMIMGLGLFGFFYVFIKALRTDISQVVNEQLPFTIDIMVKSLSKTQDLKEVLGETSQQVEGPMQMKLELLVRQLYSGKEIEEAMFDFADDLNNIWVYALINILLEYQREGRDNLIKANLQLLRVMVEKENDLATQNVTGKKYGSVINMFLAAIATAGGVLNLMFNPEAKQFFFYSFGGMLCFVVGVGAILMTVIINVTVMTKKRGG